MNILNFEGSSQQLANSLSATSFMLSENLGVWYRLLDAVSKYQETDLSDRVPEVVIREASLALPSGRSVRLVSDHEQAQVTSRVAVNHRPAITTPMLTFEFCGQRIYVCSGTSEPWFVAAYLNWSDHDKLAAALYHCGAYFTSGPGRLPSCT